MSHGKRTKPRIGLALGSGSARGWSHIGVLRALAARGIAPDVVCGTSIGALVGSAYVTEQLDTLESWARSIRLFDIVGLMDITLARGGFIAGAKLFDGLRSIQRDTIIEDLPKPFVAVATDFTTGREIWLRTGSLLDAVRASMSLPGLFPPLRRDDQWLVDGGLVNPVPVSVCRALGAEVVIAVNLNGDLTSRNLPLPPATDAASERASAPSADIFERLSAKMRQEFRNTASFLTTRLRTAKTDAPGYFEVLAGALYIMQDRITRSRMAGDPPEVALAPRLGHIRLLDFDRADEIIEEGANCVKGAWPALERAFEIADEEPPRAGRTTARARSRRA